MKHGNEIRMGKKLKPGGFINSWKCHGFGERREFAIPVSLETEKWKLSVEARITAWIRNWNLRKSYTNMFYPMVVCILICNSTKLNIQ
jgi:hypothetical protein